MNTKDINNLHSFPLISSLSNSPTRTFFLSFFKVSGLRFVCVCVCVVGVGVSAWFLYTTSYHRPCRTTTSSSTSSSETQVSYLVIKHVFFFSVFLFLWVNNNWVWYRCREIVSALAIHWQEIPTRAWSHHWCRVWSSHGHHRQSSYQASDLGHCKSHLSLFFFFSFFFKPNNKNVKFSIVYY